MLLVDGDTEAFDSAGCRSVRAVPPGAPDDAARTHWLETTLQEDRPWIDAIVALDAPPWIAQLLADRPSQYGGPWPAWIAATPGLPHCKIDCVLDGDLAQLILAAQRHARSMKPGRSE